MRLYTEEQLVRAMSLAVYNKYDKYIEVLDLLTTIELPSDEDIDEASFYIPSDSKFDYLSHQKGFEKGAKWVIKQLKNK